MPQAWEEGLPGFDEQVYAALGDIAEQVQTAEGTFERFGITASNSGRIEFICDTLRMPVEEFSILLPFPFDEWLVSDDLALVRCGMFLTDMRLSTFYMLGQHLGDPFIVFAEFAEMEWWVSQFVHRHTRMVDGKPVIDTRVRH